MAVNTVQTDRAPALFVCSVFGVIVWSVAVEETQVCVRNPAKTTLSNLATMTIRQPNLGRSGRKPLIYHLR